MTIEELKKISTLICTLQKDDENNIAKLIIKGAKPIEFILKQNADKRLEEIDNSLEKYKKNRTINKKHPKLSVVWFLTGKKNGDDDEKCIQVGRNCELDNMLYKDIAYDIISIVNMKEKEKNEKENRETRYGKLFKEYETLNFYEVNIDSYLKNDNPFFVVIDDQFKKNKFALQAKCEFLASWAEGKIAGELGAENFRVSSGIDRHSFYNYKKKNKRL